MARLQTVFQLYFFSNYTHGYYYTFYVVFTDNDHFRIALFFFYAKLYALALCALTRRSSCYVKSQDISKKYFK
jgi:hypothetical protein